jgi:phosphoribosylamine--glycine ligase
LKILVVGGGGREHALIWKLSQSPLASELFAAPGNAGTAALAKNLPIAASDIKALVTEAQSREIDLVVVGPEVPLSLGLVDALQAAGIRVFGPTKQAARLEASKAFAHEMMSECGIPAAVSRSFTVLLEAQQYVSTLTPPIVVKADGLAAGKGSIIASTPGEADSALRDIMERRVFGEAGDTVVIEEFLTGREVSLLAFTDGQHVVPMVPSCDYKRALDNDEGLNTGGMGCYSPPGFFPPHLAEEATRIAIVPIVEAMSRAGWDYRGVVYAGLMVEGESIKVLEYNARFGDPETQVILPRLKSDLVEVIMACVEGRLDQIDIEWHDGCSVGVVVASGGYPGTYKKGLPISGLDDVDSDVAVFHAGTAMGSNGEVVTDGGRVLAVVSTGENMTQARERVYRNTPRIAFDGMMYRSDIALREVK